MNPLLALLAASMALFVVLSPAQWMLAVLPMLFATYSHRWIWHILATCSAVRFLIPSALWEAPVFIKHLPDFTAGSVFLLKLSSLFAAMIIAAFLLRLKDRGLSGRKAFLIGLTIFIAAVSTEPLIRGNSWGLLVFAGFSTVFRGLFWPLAAVLLSTTDPRHMPRWQVVCLLSPAWTFMESMFIPLTPFWLASHQTTDYQSRLRAQFSGLKLLLVVFLSMALMGWFDTWAFGFKHNWIGPIHEVVRLDFRGLYDGFLALRGWKTDSPLALIGFLALTARLFLIYTIVGGLSVAIAKLSGFDLPLAVDRPHLAHSVSNFYFRIMRYYGEVLMQIFYPLTKEFGPKLRKRNHRFALNLGLTIVVGGFVYHALHYLTLFYGIASPWRILNGYSRSLPYFVAVAAVIGASVLWSNRQVCANPFRQALKVLGCFTIISAVYSLDFWIVHDRKTWTELFNLWMTLFRGW